MPRHRTLGVLEHRTYPIRPGGDVLTVVDGGDVLVDLTVRVVRVIVAVPRGNGDLPPVVVLADRAQGAEGVRRGGGEGDLHPVVHTLGRDAVLRRGTGGGGGRGRAGGECPGECQGHGECAESSEHGWVLFVGVAVARATAPCGTPVRPSGEAERLRGLCPVPEPGNSASRSTCAAVERRRPRGTATPIPSTTSPVPLMNEQPSGPPAKLRPHALRRRPCSQGWPHTSRKSAGQELLPPRRPHLYAARRGR
ncbi:hypothetical protein SGLAM104S_10514 [Streptomyces glaucescens]